MQLLKTPDLQSESLRFPTSFVALTSVKFHLCNGSGTLTSGPCQHCKQLARSSWTSFHSVKGCWFDANRCFSHTSMLLSLFFSLPTSLSKNKIFKQVTWNGTNKILFQDSGENCKNVFSVRGYSPGHAGVRIQARDQEVCWAFIMNTKQMINYYVCTMLFIFLSHVHWKNNVFKPHSSIIKGIRKLPPF